MAEEVKKTLEDLEGKITELEQKEGKTEEEITALEQAKEKKTDYQKRIDKLTFEKNEERRQREEIARKAADLEQKVADLEAKVTPSVSVDNEFEIINGKKYWKDTALAAFISDGKITDAQAIQLQQERISEKTKADIREEYQREQTRIKVLETDKKFYDDYPSFSDAHPDFDPSDKLYREANKIFQERDLGKVLDGKRIAVELAEKRLGVNYKSNNVHMDRSNDLSVTASNSYGERGAEGKKEVQLSDIEKSTGLKIWMNRTNPSTDRLYTEREALEVIKRAKARREQTQTEDY